MLTDEKLFDPQTRSFLPLRPQDWSLIETREKMRTRSKKEIREKKRQTKETAEKKETAYEETVKNISLLKRAIETKVFLSCA